MTLNTILTEAIKVTQPVNGLSSVMRYHPLSIDPSAIPVAIMWTGDFREERKGLGGAAPQTTGRKWLHVQVHAEVFQFSHSPEADEDVFRDLVNAVAAAWRANQTLNGVVMRFGEDITVEFDRPEQTDQSTVRYRAVFSSEATEEIVG